MKALEIKNFSEPIILIKLLYDGNIVVVDADTTIRILKKETLKTVGGFKAKIKHLRYTNRVVDFTTSGEYFGALTADAQETRLFSVATKKAIARVARHQGEVSCIGIDPRNLYLFSCGDDGKTFVIDIHNGKLAFTLPAHPDTINDIVFNRSGQWVARAGYDRKISIYNLEIMEQKERLSGHAKPIMKLCFAAKNRLISADKGGSIIIWDLYTSKIIARLSIHDDVTQMEVDVEGKYLFVGTKLGYIVVYCLETYEMITRKYMKFDSAVTALTFNSETNYLYIGTARGDFRVYNIYEGVDLIKYHIQKRDYGAVEEHLEENPILARTNVYDLLEQLWEKTLHKAKRLLEHSKKAEAEKLLAPYRAIPSKNSVINHLFQDYTDFEKFYQLASAGKLPLAYSLANQFPAYKESELYKTLEQRWKKRFKEAQKLSLDPRTLDQAKELLKPYRGIPEKAKDIQELFIQSDVYSRFKIDLGAKDFKQVYALLDKYPFLKQFPEYDSMLAYAAKLYQRAMEHVKKNELNLALKYLRMLVDFREFEAEVETLVQSIESQYKFFEALEANDLSKAYKTLAENEELQISPEGRKLEKMWNLALQKANKAASQGDPLGVKTAFSQFWDIPVKFAAIASVIKYAYMVELENAIKQKLDHKHIEKGFRNYLELFGMDDQIETLYEIFKKRYPESKLNIELLRKGSLERWRPAMYVGSVFEEPQ